MPDRTEGDRAPIRVLVVEDEESFVDALTIGLGREGFSVHVASDGNAAMRVFEDVHPDVVLLDQMLPGGISGLDICRSIRATSPVPIIMVTAKGTEIDTVVALEVGADDYVTKPFRMRELVARIRAVCRRSSERGADAQERREPQQGIAAEVTVDAQRRQVLVRGEEVRLRRKEFDLLHLLVENAGRVLTRDVLIDRVWGTDYIGDTKTLDVHVKRLRAQIERDPAEPRLIITVRGVGYRFNEDRS
ncbi:MAG: winged helix-turn-helix domain-containing protein [Acidimicrobiales bacterium]